MKAVRYVIDALREFFGSLLGVPSVIDRPLPKNRRGRSMFTPKQRVIDAFKNLPASDADRFRADVDALVDHDPEPRA